MIAADDFLQDATRENEKRRHSLLVSMLELAVPKWVESVQQRSKEWRVQRLIECAELFVATGPLPLFKNGPKTADVFNRVAEAIAIMACESGGVRAFGRHWIAVSPPMDGETRVG